MTTNEIARKIGVTVRTITRWERVGLISRATRDVRGWRNWEKSHIGECKKILARLHPAEVEK